MARVFRSIISGILFSAAVSLLAMGTAAAQSYNVGAVVPFPIPNQPAQVGGSLDGTTVASALQTIAGTCQVQNPENVVSIWRSGVSIGSAPCDGTFRVQVTLVSGLNVLTARTVNPSGQYGPDSAPISITLQLPPDTTPTPPPSNTPATSPPASTQELIQTTNSGTISDLSITTPQPFGVLGNANDITIQVSVSGGDTPYTIILNWGDGSTETHSVDQPGTYNFTHIYQASGNYTVNGMVRDVLGATTVLSYAVVSSTPSNTSNQHQTGTTSNSGDTTQQWYQHIPPGTVAGTAAGVAIAAGGYWIGAHQAAAQLIRGQRPNFRRGPHARPHARPKPKPRKRVR